MTRDDTLSKPISLEELAQFKRLDPLPGAAGATIAKLQKLDLAGFSEQEVRSFFIDPMIEVLGYDKGTDFSVDMGKSIAYLDKNKFPDYKFNLWRENFWLIEAKRPLPGRTKFGYDDLAQAVEYAIHPEINAALVVLCDGSITEVFDREVSLTEPVLRIEQRNLVRDFDKLRMLLEPIQAWFFQKRRVVRLIDKVFNKEFNLNRVEEFRTLIERRLAAKRPAVLENFRRNLKPDHELENQHLRSAPLEEIVDVHLFIGRSHGAHRALIEGLLAHSRPNSFRALHRVFPGEPRDANDTYMAQALTYLMALRDRKVPVQWLPAWLAQGPQNGESLESAIRCLLKWNLNYFEGDDARRCILLANNTLRRIMKLLLMGNKAQWGLGEVLHLLSRYETPELSWSQIVLSPEGCLETMLDARTMYATEQFVRAYRGSQQAFQIETAKRSVTELWKLERKLLAGIGDYRKLRRERNFAGMRLVEYSSVTYDRLGHTTLCLLRDFPEWTEYAVSEHRLMIEKLAAMNSWKARELLGLTEKQTVEPLAPEVLADRFFFGDVETWSALEKAYSD